MKTKLKYVVMRVRDCVWNGQEAYTTMQRSINMPGEFETMADALAAIEQSKKYDSGINYAVVSIKATT